MTQLAPPDGAGGARIVAVLATVDLGTSATKVAVWREDGMVAVGRADVPTFHPRPGWAEQDPTDWWASMVDAASQAAAANPAAWSAVEAIGFSAARETFVPVDAGGQPIGRGLLWSDRRADREAAVMAEASGGREAMRQATGVIVDAGTMAAKVAWLAEHDRARLEAGRWLLAPRDLLVLRLTGEVATDPTLASRTGFYRLDGAPSNVTTNGLPPLRPSLAIAGSLQDSPADALGLPAGIPVVLGAGDRACEVLGAGAQPRRPLVSWGATTNVSVPVASIPDELAPGVSISRGAPQGLLLEAGLSASGAALEWLGRLTGMAPLDLADAAADSPPGARGVVALPWFNGARGPWWQPGARAAFTNMTLANGPGDLARAVYEAVAFDVARSLEVLRTEANALMAAGGGVAGPLWVGLLAAITALPVVLRRSGEAASAGACLLTAEAVGDSGYELDAINPIVDIAVADPALIDTYRELRPMVDRVARGALVVDLSEWSTRWT